MKVLLVATSASFGDFFCRMSTPYNGNVIPVAQRPSQEKIKEIRCFNRKFWNLLCVKQPQAIDDVLKTNLATDECEGINFVCT
jgi:hypothetical protein